MENERHRGLQGRTEWPLILMGMAEGGKIGVGRRIFKKGEKGTVIVKRGCE